MKSIEKTLMYHELLMTFSNTSKFQRYELPDGYYYEFYQSGDEEKWVEIQLESGSICNYKKGLEYFHNFFNCFKDELYKRCFFIVNDNNEKIATATISLLENNEDEFEATVDWVAIKKEYLFVTLIILASFLVYSNIFHNEFIFDDTEIIVVNDLIKDTGNIPEIFSTDYWNGKAEDIFYRPLIVLSYALNYAVWNLNPFGYHLVNVLFHIFNSVLVFFLINLIFKKRSTMI